MDEEIWLQTHHAKEGIDSNADSDADTEGPKAKAVPPMPVIENPGNFVIGEKWKEDKISRNRKIERPTLKKPSILN